MRVLSCPEFSYRSRCSLLPAFSPCFLETKPHHQIPSVLLLVFFFQHLEKLGHLVLPRIDRIGFSKHFANLPHCTVAGLRHDLPRKKLISFSSLAWAVLAFCPRRLSKVDVVAVGHVPDGRTHIPMYYRKRPGVTGGCIPPATKNVGLAPEVCEYQMRGVCTYL